MSTKAKFAAAAICAAALIPAAALAAPTGHPKPYGHRMLGSAYAQAPVRSSRSESWLMSKDPTALAIRDGLPVPPVHTPGYGSSPN
jgi:hypothetical protein